jgi:hypothetical protein
MRSELSRSTLTLIQATHLLFPPRPRKSWYTIPVRKGDSLSLDLAT